MSDKTLLDVDARIAKIRDQVAAGQVSLETIAELDRLVDQRIALTVSNPNVPASHRVIASAELDSR